MSYTYTTQAEVREAFWVSHPDFTRKGNTRQNQYPADIRVAFVYFVDHLNKDGMISDKLAERVTL